MVVKWPNSKVVSFFSEQTLLNVILLVLKKSCVCQNSSQDYRDIISSSQKMMGENLISNLRETNINEFKNYLVHLISFKMKKQDKEAVKEESIFASQEELEFSAVQKVLKLCCSLPTTTCPPRFFKHSYGPE